MALKTEPEEAATNAEGTLSIQKLHNPRLGEWRSFPFLTGSNVGMVLATSGVVSNLIVYLIREFNVKNIQATQIANVVSGSMNLSPIAGAIIADSFLGCFSVIFISALVSSLGIVLLTLTATVNSMRPPSCTRGSEACEPPSTMQFGVLYAGLALVAIGNGGTRFTMLTMGANQFNKAKDQQIFIDWFFFFMYSSSVIALTAIVYTQDNVGWEWGFGICAAANTVGLLVFLLGKGYYRLVKPQGSPFAGLARVAIAAILKWRIQPSTNSGDYFHGDGGELSKLPVPVPSNGVRYVPIAPKSSMHENLQINLLGSL